MLDKLRHGVCHVGASRWANLAAYPRRHIHPSIQWRRPLVDPASNARSTVMDSISTSQSTLPLPPQQMQRGDIDTDSLLSRDGSTNHDSLNIQVSQRRLDAIRKHETQFQRKQRFRRERPLQSRVRRGREPQPIAWRRIAKLMAHVHGREISAESELPSSGPAVAAFEKQIEQIIDVYKPPSFQRQLQYEAALQGRASRPLIDAANGLFELYAHSDLRVCMSRRALRLTFGFLHKHKFAPHARQLKELLVSRRIQIPATVYNMSIQALDRSEGLEVFHQHLSRMLKWHVQPDLWTWSQFVAVVARASYRDGKELVGEMQSLGLMESARSKSLVAQHFVAHDFHEWLQTRNGDILGFFKHYDEQWRGHAWQSANAINLMVQTTVRMGQFGWTQELLDVLEHRIQDRFNHPLVNHATLNVILSSCRELGMVSAMVALTKRLSTILTRTPTDQRQISFMYATLFDLAWKRRYPNLLRVVWHHACLAGHVSNDMLDKMRTGVLNVQSKGGRRSRSAMFRELAPKLAIGIGISHMEITAALAQHGRSLSPAKSDDGTETNALTTAPDLQTRSIDEVATSQDETASSSSHESGVLPARRDIPCDMSSESHQTSGWPRLATLFQSRDVFGRRDEQSAPTSFKVSPHLHPNVATTSSLELILLADVALAGKYEPRNNLAHDMSAAYELDLQWKQRGMCEDLRQMLNEAIAVPTRRPPKAVGGRTANR